MALERGEKFSEQGGPDGLRLDIDTNDDATPALVVVRVGRKEHTATYDCAVGTGELDGGAYILNDAQVAWLDQFAELAEEAYDVARAGLPQYG